jgi:predicted SnoaL-like aldol condensation-catalyzing enzyme
MNTTVSENKLIVLEAFDTLFNKRDYKAAERLWSPGYVQHSAYIEVAKDCLIWQEHFRRQPSTGMHMS